MSLARGHKAQDRTDFHSQEPPTPRCPGPAPLSTGSKVAKADLETSSAGKEGLCLTAQVKNLSHPSQPI